MDSSVNTALGLLSSAILLTQVTMWLQCINLYTLPWLSWTVSSEKINANVYVCFSPFYHQYVHHQNIKTVRLATPPAD